MAENSTALSVIQGGTDPLALTNLAEMNSLGVIFTQSGFFSDARSAAQAVVKIIAGREMGMGPMASMTGISIVKGKVCVGATLLAAAVKRFQGGKKYDYKVEVHDDKQCKLAFYENKGQGMAKVGESIFTVEDAQKAKLLEGGADSGWFKYRKNMLFHRALSNGVKFYCPDVTCGPVYVPEELGAKVDEAGEIINVEVTPAPAAEPPRKSKAAGKPPDPPLKAAPPVAAAPPPKPAQSPAQSPAPASSAGSTASPKPPTSTSATSLPQQSAPSDKPQRIFETKFGKILKASEPLTTSKGSEYVQVSIADEDGREEGGLVCFHKHLFTALPGWRDERAFLKVVIERKGNFSYIERVDPVDEAAAAPPPDVPRGEAGVEEPEGGPDA